MLESATDKCPGSCGHESCAHMLITRAWMAKNQKWTRQLVLMVNNMFEVHGNDVPTWSEFKELWEMIQE